MTLTIDPIHAFNDNYIWLIYNEQRRAFVVDPGDAAPVQKMLAKHNLNLEGILITHHHADHTGGLLTLKKATGCTVYGPDNPNIEGIDQSVSESDIVPVLDKKFSVLEIPGHTLDHIAYFHNYKDQQSTNNHLSPILFCGDTLFAGGCGRVFEGTFPMMRASLEKLRNLPTHTRVYCAHEYTLSNLKFARTVEPSNEALNTRFDACKALRATGSTTVPSTLAEELTSNPFLRWDNPELIAKLRMINRAQATSPDDIFAALRSWKDIF